MTCHFDRKIVLVFAVWLPWLKPEAVESWLTFTLSYDVAGIQAACHNHNWNCVWAPLRLCDLVIEGNLTLLGPSTFANFRCNLVSEKRFSVSARYAWELPEKIVERGVCEEPFVFTVPLPVREPRVRSVISVWSTDCQYRALRKATES